MLYIFLGLLFGAVIGVTTTLLLNPADVGTGIARFNFALPLYVAVSMIVLAIPVFVTLPNRNV